ncbi:MAG: site-2 protease family protein [Patescibacteria group bacterium]
MIEVFIVVLVAGIFLMSVIAHEVSHGAVALALGDPTAKYEGRLTLNPIKHIDPWGSIVLPLVSYLSFGFAFGYAKPVPYNPYNLRNQQWGPAMVAVAGPLTNIVLAVAVAIIYRLLPETSQYLMQYRDILAFVVSINIWLAIFNLVPIPPLDGSKVLAAVLPYRMRTIIDAIEAYGIIFLLIFVFFFVNLLGPLFSRIVLALLGS